VGAVGTPWPWWGHPGLGGDTLALVGTLWLLWGCRGHGGNAVAMVAMPWVWWRCRGCGGDTLALVGTLWLSWGCPGHGGDALAVVGMPWPCTPQARAASPALSALGKGHRSRGRVGEQRLGGDCRVTWAVLSSQLVLVPGSGLGDAWALAAPFPQPPAGTQTPTAQLQPCAHPLCRELREGLHSPVRSHLPLRGVVRNLWPQPSRTSRIYPYDSEGCSGRGVWRDEARR